MLGWKQEEFSGFAPEDFAAFAPTKWGSNRFNLERMRATDRLAAFGEALVASRPALPGGLRRVVSEPSPSLFNRHRVEAAWLSFHRAEDEQRSILAAMEAIRPLAETVQDPRPLHKEVLLCVRLDEAGLDVGLYLHSRAWVDGQNLLRLDDEGRAKLLALAAASPVPLRWTVDGQDLAPEAALTAFAALVEGEGEGGWLRLHEALTREDPRLGSPEIVAPTAALLEALLPLRALVAWAPDNDRLELTERVAEHQATARPAPAPAPAPAPTPLSDEDRLPAWARYTPKPPPPRPAPRPARPPRPQAPERPREARPAPAPRAERPARPAPPPRREDRPKPPAPRPARPAPEAPPALRPSDEPLAVGCQARVNAGLFRGQVGKVLDLDARGKARVLIHARTVSIEARDLQRLA